jgi:hypothetical protein
MCMFFITLLISVLPFDSIVKIGMDCITLAGLTPQYFVPVPGQDTTFVMTCFVLNDLM